MSQINETAIKTPGVYTTEIPSFPPSVAQVDTAVPAFIGYTQKATAHGQSLINVPYEIFSMAEYIFYFGGEYVFGNDDFIVHVDPSNDYAFDRIEYTKKFIMFDSVRQFYDNGGGKCYIVCVGLYDSVTTGITLGNELADPIVPGLRVGLKELEKYDEPTLILFPDAVLLTDEGDFYSLQQMAIEQCAKLQDRFTLCDIKENVSSRSLKESVQSFRDSIGINDLSYAAAYTPWLYTTYNKAIDFRVINGNVQDTATATIPLNALPVDPTFNNLIKTLENNIADEEKIKADITALAGSANSLADQYNSLRIAVINSANPGDLATKAQALFTFLNSIAVVLPPWQTAIKNASLVSDMDSTARNSAAGLGVFISKLIAIEKNATVQADLGITHTPANFTDYDNGGTKWINVADADANIAAKTPDYPGATEKDRALAMIVELDDIMKRGISSFITKVSASAKTYSSVSQDQVYRTHPVVSKIINALNMDLAKIPPSGSIAGIYAKVDGTRGVWKAPANVSINFVTGPSELIDDLTQEDFNVDVTAGKSINAIRTFIGKGTIVWGARTLNASSNEWRYISVRRFFIMVEESAKKATMPFVFEPNDANTWVKVRGMLENYLTILWRQGALAGAKPEQAFFVKCGLGQTMTAQDILNGLLIVEIGMAAVRPAEFIILRFSHKLQEL